MAPENTERTRYLIIGYSRSGTSVTSQLIGGHPNANSFVGELKPSPFFQHGFNIFTHGKASRDKEKEFPALFDALTLINADQNTHVHGAKVACNSPAGAGWIVDVLENYLPDLKVILVKRKDMVALMGSGIHGAKSGIMHSWNEGYGGHEVQTLTISRHKLITFMRWVTKLYAVFDQLKQTHRVLEIEHADLSADMSTEAAKIFRFLEIPELEPEWVTSKKVMPPAKDYIKRYDELSELQRQFENNELSSTSVNLARAASYAGARLRRLGIGN